MKIKKKEVIGNPQTYKAIKTGNKNKNQNRRNANVGAKNWNLYIRCISHIEKVFGVFLYNYLKLASYYEHIHKTNLIFFT